MQFLDVLTNVDNFYAKKFVVCLLATKLSKKLAKLETLSLKISSIPTALGKLCLSTDFGHLLKVTTQD